MACVHSRAPHRTRGGVRRHRNHPRWQPYAARACRLPITSTFDVLHVGLFDADFSDINVDDPLGRVALPLIRLHPQTVYTAWLPLHVSPGEDVYVGGGHIPCHGAVRLRYVRRCVLPIPDEL